MAVQGLDLIEYESELVTWPRGISLVTLQPIPTRKHDKIKATSRGVSSIILLLVMNPL